MSELWSAEQAEGYLLGLERLGMHFGLERMQRLLTVLGSPQRELAAIHVVGTNGKTSTVRMIAALMRAHGLRCGAYLSPHLRHFNERIEIDGEPLAGPAFAAAVQRVARATTIVHRTLEPDSRVTQFEALTAAALGELAARKVEVAAIEAGLGGRYDATNVLASRVAVLTNVGLEHTRLLGPTIRDIAREKLAVLRERSTLVVGELHPDALAEAQIAARERDARLVQATSEPPVAPAAPGAYQRRNFALACTAAEAFLGRLDPAAVRRAAADVRVPGRLEVIDQNPLTFVDVAHNPDGVAALAASLPELIADRRLVCVVSILDDKDAAAMLALLIERSAALVLTSNRNPRALSPSTLLSLARQLGCRAAEVQSDPTRALARARELAGHEGVVLATGSHYLISDLTTGSQGLASML